MERGNRIIKISLHENTWREVAEALRLAPANQPGSHIGIFIRLVRVELDRDPLALPTDVPSERS